jgi:hypothetical protein
MQNNVDQLPFQSDDKDDIDRGAVDQDLYGRLESGGAKSMVETGYEACACSPMEKVKMVSRPCTLGGSK